MSRRAGEAALRTAAAWVGHSYPAGLCLQWVRGCYSIAARYGSAAMAWRYAKNRHTSSPPPRGYPVFYTGGSRGYGHVAVSAGGGYIYSTDLPGRGKVGKVHYKEPERRWGVRYAGWTSDVNGVSVWCRTVDLSKLRYAAKGHPWSYKNGTATVQWHLHKRGLLPLRNVNGYFGKATREAYAKWQRRLGYTDSAADGIPGLTSLRHLGWYAPFLVANP